MLGVVINDAGMFIYTDTIFQNIEKVVCCITQPAANVGVEDSWPPIWWFALKSIVNNNYTEMEVLGQCKTIWVI